MKTACENATRRTTWLGSSDLLSACSSSKTTSTVSRCGDELLDGTSTTSQKYWESPCYSVRLPWPGRHVSRRRKSSAKPNADGQFGMAQTVRNQPTKASCQQGKHRDASPNDRLKSKLPRASPWNTIELVCVGPGYLRDRIRGSGEIPRLSDLMRSNASTASMR